MSVVYVAKPGEWFDAGTVAMLVDDYRPDMEAGLFRGVRDGKLDEEVCAFAEFDVIEEP
jgi:hypothetical protein